MNAATDPMHDDRLRQLAGLDLDTPALVLDLDALEANIATMAAFARANGVGLRPHAKTHKSADIGRLQLAAGAVGLCCAKLGEAEALAAEDLGPLLVTSPVVGPRKLERLAHLAARAPDLMVVVDHPEAVEALATTLAMNEHRLGVLVDLDPGMARTGVADTAAAIDLARQVMAAPRLRFAASRPMPATSSTCTMRRRGCRPPATSRPGSRPPSTRSPAPTSAARSSPAAARGPLRRMP